MKVLGSSGDYVNTPRGDQRDFHVKQRQIPRYKEEEERSYVVRRQPHEYNEDKADRKRDEKVRIVY